MEPPPAYYDNLARARTDKLDVSRAATLITVVVVFGLLVALALFFLYKCTTLCVGRRVATSSAARPQHYTVVPDHVMMHTSIERFLMRMAEEKPIRFTAEQLAGYTGNYSAQLGRGGFGVVYWGELPNGLAMAVKVLRGELDRNTSEQQFMAEMETIGTTHHINLVRLYGYCFDGATHALVYEFMEHGALDAYLSARGPEGVSMATVAAISTGVARGLRYLHEECQRKIVHYDIKPGNVLLDGSLTPKVADFGLARLVSRTDTHVSLSRFRGTRGFAAPEVWNELRATEKCDVYSFGMLLLDIIRIRLGMNRFLVDVDVDAASGGTWFPIAAWIRYEAGRLTELLGRYSGGEDELAERLCKVAFWCAQERPRARPSMSNVVKMLEQGDDIAPPPNPFQYLMAPPSAANLRMAMATSSLRSTEISSRFETSNLATGLIIPRFVRNVCCE